MPLYEFSGGVSLGQRFGDPVWQFAATELKGYGTPKQVMCYITDPALASRLEEIEADADNSRILDITEGPDTFKHPKLPTIHVEDFERPRYSVTQQSGHGGYYAVVHPRGDTSRITVAQIGAADEDDWSFASDGRFDDEKDAAAEMADIAAERGLTVEDEDTPSFGMR